MDIKLYTVRWRGSGLVPAHDCNPDGTQEPYLLLVGKENAAKAAKYQTEMYGDMLDNEAVAISLEDAIAEGLFQPTP